MPLMVDEVCVNYDSSINYFSINYAKEFISDGNNLYYINDDEKNILIQEFFREKNFFTVKTKKNEFSIKISNNLEKFLFEILSSNEFKSFKEYNTYYDEIEFVVSGGELKRFSLRRYDEPRDWNLSFAVSLIDKEYYLIVFMPWVKNKIISFSMDHERLYFELESGEKIQFKLILPEFVKNTVLNLFKLINPLSLV